MPAASILIKPASAACNMACRYCFYREIACGRAAGTLPVMSNATLEALVREAMRYAEGQITFAWQGGEPMLAGLPFFRRAVELQRAYARPGLRVLNTLQTNGTLIDGDWAAFLAEHGFLVGVSLDGPRKLHDAARVGRGGEGTFARTMRGIDALREHGVDFNVLTVVTERSAASPAAVYRFLTGQGFEWLQFIPCMGELPGAGQGRGADDAGDASSWAVAPRAYGEFLCTVFDLWYADFQRGSAPDIRFFSNLAQMAAGFPPEECGMCGRCTTYFAVESDGSVYPCDFYTTDAWLLGHVDDGFGALFASERSREFMASSVPKPDACLACPWFRLCRGGCRRWRDAGRMAFGIAGAEVDPVAGEGGLGVNYLCEGYKLFFEHCAPRIARLGEVVRRNVAMGLV